MFCSDLLTDKPEINSTRGELVLQKNLPDYLPVSKHENLPVIKPADQPENCLGKAIDHTGTECSNKMLISAKVPKTGATIKTRNDKTDKTASTSQSRILAGQVQKWKKNAKMRLLGENFPLKNWHERAIVKPSTPDIMNRKIDDVIDVDIEKILYSPKTKRNVVNDDRKDAFDEEMDKIHSVNLDMKFDSEKRCHLPKKNNNVLLSQSETSREKLDQSETIKVLLKDNYELNGSGLKTQMIASKICDLEKNLTQKVATRLEGMPLTETMRAGPSSATIGTDVRGITPPRPSIEKSGSNFVKNCGQKPPPELKEMARGAKGKNVRAIYEKFKDIDENKKKGGHKIRCSK